MSKVEKMKIEIEVDRQRSRRKLNVGWTVHKRQKRSKLRLELAVGKKNDSNVQNLTCRKQQPDNTIVMITTMMMMMMIKGQYQYGSVMRSTRF